MDYETQCLVFVETSGVNWYNASSQCKNMAGNTLSFLVEIYSDEMKKEIELLVKTLNATNWWIGRTLLDVHIEADRDWFWIDGMLTILCKETHLTNAAFPPL